MVIYRSLLFSIVFLFEHFFGRPGGPFAAIFCRHFHCVQFTAKGFPRRSLTQTPVTCSTIPF